MNQTTLIKPAIFTGIGVHCGKPATVTVLPAAAGAGLSFINRSFPDQPMLLGTVVPEVAMHATVLKCGKWGISTVEHLVAAIALLGIDNAVIEIDGYEVPILDGSALPFVQGLLEAGIVELEAPKHYLMPHETIRLADEQGRWIELSPLVDLQVKKLEIEYVAEFKHPLVGSLEFKGAVTTDSFIRDIAPARTFGFLSQLPYLRAHNLAQGSSLGNTLVIDDEQLMNEPRFEDECVRHKVLDLLGDLALLGKNLVGTVKAFKTSHSFNRLVIKHFIEHSDKWTLV